MIAANAIDARPTKLSYPLTRITLRLLAGVELRFSKLSGKPKNDGDLIKVPANPKFLASLSSRSHSEIIVFVTSNSFLNLRLCDLNLPNQ